MVKLYWQTHKNKWVKKKDDGRKRKTIFESFLRIPINKRSIRTYVYVWVKLIKYTSSNFLLIFFFCIVLSTLFILFCSYSDRMSVWLVGLPAAPLLLSPALPSSLSLSACLRPQSAVVNVSFLYVYAIVLLYFFHLVLFCPFLFCLLFVFDLMAHTLNFTEFSPFVLICAKKKKEKETCYFFFF